MTRVVAGPVAAATTAPSPAPGFGERVVAWQAVHGRHDLPWQQTRDPYRVWLSEVMLQQTQVGTVLAYYDRFLARFPNVLALAAAPLDDVLSTWSGLGYYRRARLLHQGAQAVVQHHGGVFPSSAAALETLPGVGRSTAAAIAAFCFGEAAAILDGNVKRVLTRHAGFEGDLNRAAEMRGLWALAQQRIPARGVEAYTQGLMDLGSNVCVTRRPRCLLCPVADDCVARLQGRPESYPVAPSTLKRSIRTSVWLWVEHRGYVLLVRRPDAGVWGGLWSLPEFVDFDALRRATAGWPGHGESMPTAVHALTHFDWTLHPRRWCLPPGADREAWAAGLTPTPGSEGRQTGCWVTPAQALTLGLPTPWRRMMTARIEADARPP